MREHRMSRGYLCAGVHQRRPVRHVGRKHSAAEHPSNGAHEFHRGQVGRGAPRGEHVRDHYVEGVRPQPVEHVPGVPDPDPDPDPAQRQPEPDQVDQRGVDLDGHLR
jgi:hypothetical protein